MATWLVNLLSSMLGIGALVLAHYGLIPQDIASIIAGGVFYQLGGQAAYHFSSTFSKSNSNGNMPAVPANGSGASNIQLDSNEATTRPTSKGTS